MARLIKDRIFASGQPSWLVQMHRSFYPKAGTVLATIMLFAAVYAIVYATLNHPSAELELCSNVANMHLCVCANCNMLMPTQAVAPRATRKIVEGAGTH